VVGVDAVVSLRSEDPTVPVVALVDELSPIEAVLAQTAGADVVLHTRPGFDHDQQPGLELAVRAASTMARRRRELAATSRQTGHDIAEALNVIGLIAQAGQQSRLDQTAAFTQIHDLVRKAGDDAWRAGRANRSSSFVVSAVDLGQLLQSGRLPPGVEICAPEPETYVFVDEPWLLDALGEVVGNARRAGATSVEIDASTRANRQTVTIVVSDDGHGFPAERSAIGQPFVTDAGSERLGVGLASIAEQAAELSGNLTLLDPGGDRTLTRVALSLPRIDAETLDPTVGEAGVEEAGTAPISSVDPATAQANILEGVVRHAPLDESLEGIVTAIENQLPGTICSVLSLHDGCRLKHSAGARLPLAYREAIDGVVIGVGQGSCGTAAHTGRPVVASDVTTDRNWVDFRSIAIEHGLRSCWSTPIVAAEGGETLGTFAVYTPTVWSPDREAIRLVNRFTYLAAVAIEHHRLFGALAESEARFRSAFEGAAAGIALASLGGAVLKANPALVELVGRPAAVLAGTSLLDLVDPEYRGLVTDSWACLTDDDRGADRVDNVEVPLAPSLEGPQRWLSLHTSLIPGESGRHPYLYVEARDVTAARQQLADMRAREAAEAANRAKTDFLALASHELRTPLNAILGFAQIMQLLELDERQRSDSVDQIVNAGRHLRDLIDELLDLSRIESGQLAVETGRVDACEVIDEAIELVGPLAAARDIVVVSHIEVGQAPWVLADHRCMRQVLINLLDNAVKYTSSGGRVDVAADDVDGSSVVRIRVTDSGPGISPDSLEAIFQPFHRLDRAADDESEGTGLGLALCARLMGEMGGSIGVTSTVGVGSSFWIEFPTATGADTHPATASSAGNRADAATAASSIEHAEGSVLYIEDDPACLDVMDEALRLRPKVTLHSARSAADGAAEIAGHHLDLVLLDVGLPDRSGWDLLAELRVTHPTLPVIVLTAGPDSVPTDVEPPDQMFTKPIDVGEVLRAIDRACSGPTGSDLFAEVVDSGHQ
jgi:PAS domain S-box-containing protein